MPKMHRVGECGRISCQAAFGLFSMAHNSYHIKISDLMCTAERSGGLLLPDGSKLLIVRHGTTRWFYLFEYGQRSNSEQSRLIDEALAAAKEKRGA